MWLDAGYEDWQLPALAAPPSCNSHAQRLVGFFLHSDVLLLTGYTLGKVLRKESHRGNTDTHARTHTEMCMNKTEA